MTWPIVCWMALEMRRFLARLLPSLAKTYWSNRAEEVELTTANNDSRYDPPSVVSVENSVFKNGVTRGVSQHQHIEATGVKRMVSWTEKLKPGRSHKVVMTQNQHLSFSALN